MDIEEVCPATVTYNTINSHLMNKECNFLLCDISRGHMVLYIIEEVLDLKSKTLLVSLPNTECILRATSGGQVNANRD